jgi:hypothetical protein
MKVQTCYTHMLNLAIKDCMESAHQDVAGTSTTEVQVSPQHLVDLEIDD